MDTKSVNALLILLFLGAILLALSGQLDIKSFIPASISKAVLQWRLGWISLGAALAFFIVWGRKIAPEKALWGAMLCALLAYLFL